MILTMTRIGNPIPKNENIGALDGTKCQACVDAMRSRIATRLVMNIANQKYFLIFAFVSFAVEVISKFSIIFYLLQITFAFHFCSGLHSPML